MLPKNEQYSFCGPHLAVAIVYFISPIILDFFLYPHILRVSVLSDKKISRWPPWWIEWCSGHHLAFLTIPCRHPWYTWLKTSILFHSPQSPALPLLRLILAQVLHFASPSADLLQSSPLSLFCPSIPSFYSISKETQFLTPTCSPSFLWGKVCSQLMDSLSNE